MAGIGDFLDPMAQPAPAAAPDQDGLRQRWDQYLNNPTTQAALLSFSAQAAQPRQWGQSNFGHLMSSVGQGGASVRQTEELDRKQQEADSKSDLRESQAMAAEARAGAAGANANSAASRLELGHLREQGLNERGMLGRRIQAYKLYGQEVARYQAEVARINKLNQDNQLFRRPLLPLPPPVQTPQEWFTANRPLMQGIGITPEMLAGETTTPQGGPDPSMPQPGAPASPAPTASPTGPAPPIASRPDGYTMNHPTRGHIRWDAKQQKWFPTGQ